MSSSTPYQKKQEKSDQNSKLTRWTRFLARLNGYEVAVFIGFGLFGFLFCIAILFATCAKPGPYGTFKFVNKETVINNMLQRRISSITALNNKNKEEAAALQKKVDDANQSTEKPNNVIKLNTIITEIAKLDGYIWLARREQIWLNNRNTDTAVSYYSRNLQVDRKKLLAAINDTTWNGDTSRKVYIATEVTDTCRCLLNSPVVYKDSLTLKQNKQSLIDLATDYPSFGFWVVISIAQMMLWFIIVPMLAGNMLNLQGKITNYVLEPRQRWANGLIPAVVLVAFCTVFYKVIIDRYIVTDGYFLNNFTVRMIIYGAVGYIVAGFCFYNFLTVSDQFDRVDDLSKETIEAKVNADKALVAQQNENADTKKTVDNKLTQNVINAKDEAGKALAEYQTLKASFDNAFLCSAAVLSVFVFTEGVLFNALNNTEVFRFYQQLNGRPVISSDFVYLMGLLHCCILLIFYVPVKIKFSSLFASQPAMQAAAGVPVKGVFAVFFNNLGTILVTASPLIAGFVQDLVKTFLNP